MSTPAVFPGEPGGPPAIERCEWGDLIAEPEQEYRECRQPASIVEYWPPMKLEDGSTYQGGWTGYCARHHLVFGCLLPRKLMPDNSPPAAGPEDDTPF